MGNGGICFMFVIWVYVYLVVKKSSPYGAFVELEYAIGRFFGFVSHL